MNRKSIPFHEFSSLPFHLYDKQWLLLSSGDFKTKHFNCMTISWGALGYIWDRPLAIAVVRPTRYTMEFMEQYDTFTLCAFPAQYRSALNLLGTKSGRDGNKIESSGLTPMSGVEVAAPVYEEAELAIECRKTYWQDLDPSHFLFNWIENKYPIKDYHRMYFGEILAIASA